MASKGATGFDTMTGVENAVHVGDVVSRRGGAKALPVSSGIASLYDVCSFLGVATSWLRSNHFLFESNAGGISVEHNMGLCELEGEPNGLISCAS